MAAAILPHSAMPQSRPKGLSILNKRGEEMMNRQSAKRKGVCIVTPAPWTAAMAAALMPLSLSGRSTTPIVFAGLQTTVSVSSLIAPVGVAISARNLFVLDRGANQVIEARAHSSSQKTVATGLLAPAAMDADTAGSRSKSTKEKTHGK
jgi:hypothetical protein